MRKPLRRGGNSDWFFLASDDSSTYFAESSTGRRLTCASIDELRGLYRRFQTYGFALV